jgi:hypothetical protein
MTQAGQLDQISEAIGRLSAQTGHLHECVHRVGDKVDKLETALVLDQGDLARLKAKGAGILIGVSLASGFVGSKLSGLGHLLGRVAG